MLIAGILEGSSSAASNASDESRCTLEGRSVVPHPSLLLSLLILSLFFLLSLPILSICVTSSVCLLSLIYCPPPPPPPLLHHLCSSLISAPSSPTSSLTVSPPFPINCFSDFTFSHLLCVPLLFQSSITVKFHVRASPCSPRPGFSGFPYRPHPHHHPRHHHFLSSTSSSVFPSLPPQLISSRVAKTRHFCPRAQKHIHQHAEVVPMMLWMNSE